MSSWQKVLDTAKDLRNRYHHDGQPLEETFRKICSEKNIELQYAEQGEHTSQKDGKLTITLPLNTSRVRDNFTMAHELGHIFLEHPLNEDGVIHRSGVSTKEEVEANLFAAEFLMPKEQFIEAAKKYNYDEKQLSNEFEVSKTASLVRMSALKLTSK
ncbi:ImmA/IrrE family metallo-endopeptidase [Desulfovibrio intestinalis]|uniref:Zn-dependent peptidase ImmA (M78 family) n=1 Tax=Desulfovibrio intestinalis TaxID=58621 RepID=A0A7W8C5L4_9BACT|nr:ImmA/IrrE family metallo-endopeptidase [Desulfovibrio intestinalis]MBB5144180.1 Zn-dependent peptidase ImmA (M78 family) [Desulfovibrio intestinalis]